MKYPPSLQFHPMKRSILIGTLTGTLIALSTGCHKADPSSDLEKTAEVMAKTPPAAPAAGAEPAAGPPPAEQVKEAISDYKAGKFEDAVARLHLIRSMPGLSPLERISLNDSMASVIADIYAQAEKGNPSAIAARAQYEKMQTHQ
jgi:hypothetical protein